MSFRYKILEHGIRAIGIKKMYDMPEDKLLRYLKTNHRAYDMPDFVYKRLAVKKTDMDGQLLFKLEPEDGANEKVIFFIHGGGGMMCPTRLHYRMAVKLVKNTGAALYFPFYPLGPEASVVRAADWLDLAYNEVLKKHDPKNITIIGDSAGAALSVCVCRRTERKPSGVVIISPSTGIEKEYEQMRELERDDLMLSVRTLEIVKKHWLKGMSLENADFCTSSVDYSDFPPMLLYYGTNEIFYAYIEELIAKIKSGGVDLRVFEGKGLCHDWAIMGFMPEGQRAFEQICNFIKK
ncbi:MAG: alpha/beta hydrolase [Clostridia bacterium]|nr:alpha/beta hydrolase [Clostridia bacterium]